MRILAVTGELHDDGSGGGGIYVYNLCKELARQGHDVDLISPMEPNASAPFKMHRVKLSKSRVVGMLKWSIEAYICSTKLMKTRRYDLVNVHSPLSFVFPCLYSSRIPMVVTVLGGWALTNPHYKIHERLFYFVRDFISWQKAAKVVVLNNSLKRRLLRWRIFQKRVEYVPNAIDWNRFSEKPDASRMFLSKFGVPQDAIVVLYVGRLEKGKGVEHLLEATRIIQNGPVKKIWVVIVGVGSLLSNLARRYQDLENVVFTGFLSGSSFRSDLVSVYRESDLFVMPSEGGEGMPTVLLEAMAAGLPIVSTQIPGTVDTVRGEFGVFVDPGNPKQLASAILDVVADKLRMKKMGRRARSCSQQFDWTFVAARIMEVFETCLEGNHKNRHGVTAYALPSRHSAGDLWPSKG